MKIVVLLGDGMSGEPLEALGDKTTLQTAATPNMDRLAGMGAVGVAATVPESYPAGSDVANLSVFGYDPKECYTGRAPLEAAAMGVELGPGDVAYRMNLVSLLAGNQDVYMHDFTAGHISSEEAGSIVATLAEELSDEDFEFYPGVSYRHLFVWRNGESEAKTTPPHDITEKAITPHLPSGPGADTLVSLMTSSQILLKTHPVNAARLEAGSPTADSIWLWGQGGPPKMSTYQEMFGLTGKVICAVDLMKGIGKMAGLDCPFIPGATGYLDTDYDAKASAAIEALKEVDFIYLHVEAPDEAGHAGLMEEKITAIERFDEKVVGPVVSALEESGEPFRVLVMPDHPTPLSTRTHSRDMVPFIVYESDAPTAHMPAAGYDEVNARSTGLVVDQAHALMAHLAGKKRLW